MIIHNIRYMYSYLLNVFHHINCNFQRTKAKYTFLEDRSLDGKRVIRRSNSRKDRQNNHLKKKKTIPTKWSKKEKDRQWSSKYYTENKKISKTNELKLE